MSSSVRPVYGPAEDFRRAILARCPSAVEVLNKRGRYSKTWRLPNAPDGRTRFALDVSVAPVHYLGAEGRWQEIDYSHPKAHSIAEGQLIPMDGRLVPAVAGGSVIIDDQVAENLGDTQEKEDTGLVTDNTTFVQLTDKATTDRNWGGFRWHSAVWPGQGDIIDVAYAEVNVFMSAYDDIHHHIYADDSANPAALTTANSDLSGRTPTTAKVDWQADAIGAGFVQSPSLVSIIQELVTSHTVQAVALVFKSGTSGDSHAVKSCYVVAHNYAPSSAAKLHIEYTTFTLRPGSIASAEAFGTPALWHRYRVVSDYNDDGEYLPSHMWAENLPVGFCAANHEYTGFWTNFDWHECGLEDRPYAGDGLGAAHDYYIQISDFHLFPMVAIPTGWVVSYAYMQMTRKYATPGPPLLIDAEAADDAQPITSAADFESRVRTTAKVEWTPSVVDGDYSTPSLLSLINEVLRRPGWSSGNGFQLFFEPTTTIPNPDPQGMWSWQAARNLSPPPALREDRPRLFVRLTLGALPVGMASAEVFGTPNVRRVVSPSSVASSETFGTASVSVGAVTLQPGAITSAETLGSPSVAGPITISGIATAETFGTAQINLGMTAGGIASTETFGTATLTTGAVSVSPDAVVSAEGFGSALITVLGVPQTITASAITSAEALGSPVVAGAVGGAGGIASAEAFGSHAVAVGTAYVAPPGVISLEAFGIPTLARVVLPSGVASAESFGSIAVSAPGGEQELSPSAIPSVEVFGAIVVAGPVTVSGIASGEGFGDATLETLNTITLSSGIGSSEGVGTPELSGAHFVFLMGISSAEAFGATTVITLLVVVSPSGVASVEAFGALALTLYRAILLAEVTLHLADATPFLQVHLGSVTAHLKSATLILNTEGRN